VFTTSSSLSPSPSEGEEIYREGFTPLLPTLSLPLPREGSQRDRLLNNLTAYREKKLRTD
jgi:hypothetical protein